MTGKRGLILGGGGVAGIAWETGVLAGLADGAPEAARELLGFEVLVGTSAGAAVAAQLTSGLDLDELLARQTDGPSAEIDPGVDVESVAELFLQALTGPAESAQARRQRIGEVAAAAKTVDAAVRREVIAARLPSHDWPSRDLRITAVDVASGELAVFQRYSGVPLVDAVAASCAVPGAWPPVHIGDRTYMDGGVRSTVNLDVAGDCGTVVVLCPMRKAGPTLFGAGAAVEIEQFPGRAFAIFADEAAEAAFGENPLNPASRKPSALAGREQGRRQAEAMAAFLGV